MNILTIAAIIVGALVGWWLGGLINPWLRRHIWRGFN